MVALVASRKDTSPFASEEICEKKLTVGSHLDGKIFSSRSDIIRKIENERMISGTSSVQ